MSNKSKYLSSTGFTDLLFNVVVGLAFLFILAFILMNPIAKTKDIEISAKFANAAAAVVVGKTGTATVTIDEINNYISIDE